MKVVFSDNVMKFQGVLDEKTDLGAIAEAFRKALSETHEKRLVVDFLNVKRANSLGIIRWNEFVQKIGCGIVYENAPQWLVEQFNFWVISINSDSSVSSILAPFYCGEDGTHEVVRLVIGADVPVLSDYSTFTIERTSKNGLRLEADFEPTDYFGFLVPEQTLRKSA